MIYSPLQLKTFAFNFSYCLFFHATQNDYVSSFACNVCYMCATVDQVNIISSRNLEGFMHRLP